MFSRGLHVALPMTTVTCHGRAGKISLSLPASGPPFVYNHTTTSFNACSRNDVREEERMATRTDIHRPPPVFLSC